MENEPSLEFNVKMKRILRMEITTLDILREKY